MMVFKEQSRQQFEEMLEQIRIEKEKSVERILELEQKLKGDKKQEDKKQDNSEAE